MDVGQLQHGLYRHLAVMGLLSLALGFTLGRPEWSYAACLGFGATAAYFWLLGRQIVRTLNAGRQPAPAQTIGLMAGRQGLGLLACYVALMAWGPAWWATLIAQLIGRHWVMVVSRPLATPKL